MIFDRSFLEKASLVDAVNPTNTPDVIYTKDLCVQALLRSEVRVGGTS